MFSKSGHTECTAVKVLVRGVVSLLIYCKSPMYRRNLSPVIPSVTCRTAGSVGHYISTNTCVYQQSVTHVCINTCLFLS